MNVNILNTLAAVVVFVLVAGALVVLAAMIGGLLCRRAERASSLAGRFSGAEHAGRGGTTAVCGN